MMSDHFTGPGDDRPGMDRAILQGTTGAWWDEFFADRSKDIPFFAEWPDAARTTSASWPGPCAQAGTLGGGLGYSEHSLRSLWDKPPFSVRVLRQMNQTGGHDPYFGLDFLWVMLATRQDES